MAEKATAGNQFAFAYGIPASLDLLANVDVVLDIFQGCIFRQLFEDLANLSLADFMVQRPSG
jgi:hypothetical protein